MQANAERNDVTVGRNVHVSVEQPASAHDEVMLAIDPNNSQRMLACSVVLFADSARRATVSYVSTDGGDHWHQVLRSDYFRESADPTCIIGTDGTMHVGIEGGDVPDVSVDLYRSQDAGKTWLPRSRPYISDYDRHFFAVDGNRASPYHGRLYLNAYKGVRTLKDSHVKGFILLHSTDAGATWEQPAIRVSDPDQQASIPGNCDVLSSGTVVCALTVSKDAANSLAVVRSSDGGRSLSASTTVDRLVKAKSGFSAPIVPRLAVDHTTGPFKDRAYLVWHDRRSGRDEIWLSYSDDAGVGWSTATRVNDDFFHPTGDATNAPNHYMPQVVVNRAGVVGVLWYDRRDRSLGQGYQPRFTASHDGGETFLPSVPISEVPHRVGQGERWPIAATDGVWLGLRSTGPKHLRLLAYVKHMTGGETSGLGVDGKGTFHALWTDDRTGVDQVWTAPITVRGAAVRHGSPELSNYVDVSDQVRLDIDSVAYHGDTNVVVRVAFRNVSKDTLRGPLVARLVRLASGLTGPVTPLAADNVHSGPGAIWRFTTESADGVLPPGSRTRRRVLAFRQTSPHALSGISLSTWDWNLLDILDMDLLILAPRSR